MTNPLSQLAALVAPPAKPVGRPAVITFYPDDKERERAHRELRPDEHVEYTEFHGRLPR